MKTKERRNVKRLKIGHDLDLGKISEKTIQQEEARKKKIKNKSESDFSLLGNLNLGFYLVTPLISFLIFGIILDNILHTRPILTLVFIILGTIGSFYNLIKFVKENQ